MATVKALIPGVAITMIMSAVLAAGGAQNRVLAIDHANLYQHDFYWSWPLFLCTFGLARALLWLMDG